MTKPTRRRFLKTAAPVALGAAFPLAAAPTIIEAAEPPVSADQALAAIARQRYKFLSEDQLKAVQRGLQLSVALASILQRTRLDPVDEPATIFVSDVAE